MTRPDRIGPKIRRARERLHLDRKTLAAAVGASPRAVYDWEHDRTYPRNRIGALEEVLGIKLTGDDGEPRPVYADPGLQKIWEIGELSEEMRRGLIAWAVAMRAEDERRRRSDS